LKTGTEETNRNKSEKRLRAQAQNLTSSQRCSKQRQGGKSKESRGAKRKEVVLKKERRKSKYHLHQKNVGLAWKDARDHKYVGHGKKFKGNH